MSWECKTVEEQRTEFVRQAKQQRNFSAVCREHGITRKTGYKWVERYECGLPMSDRDRTPARIANKTDDETVRLILAVRDENPGWGAKTIRQVLLNQGHENLPCAKTINNILHRNGRIDPAESEKRVPFVRFAKEHCNEMWQTDFKGEFKMNNGKYCYPLDILDDSTRFAIKIVPAASTANVVIPSFLQAFQEYGLPDSVLSDNGCQFAGFRHGFTHFEKLLMNLDILPIHGRTKHPQTQGKIERFHRTMKDELLRHTVFDCIEDADQALQSWRYKYNHIRPHEALNMLCPSDLYVRSRREYPDRISDYEYGGEHHVIKVNSWGYVRFAHFQVYISETMIGENIEFRHAEDGNSFFACYRNFRIAQFDSHSGKLLNRRICRL